MTGGRQMAVDGKTALTPDERAVAAVVRGEVEGMLHKDIDQLHQLIAPDARLGHITGKVESRKEWLNQIKLGRMRYLSNQEVSLKVDVKPDGKHATAVCDNELEARIFGFTNTWPLESTMSLEKRHGHWLIVSAKTAMF